MSKIRLEKNYVTKVKLNVYIREAQLLATTLSNVNRKIVTGNAAVLRKSHLSRIKKKCPVLDI